jgi:hypothetical protein
VAAALPDDAEDDRRPQAGALADFLGGEHVAGQARHQDVGEDQVERGGEE